MPKAIVTAAVTGSINLPTMSPYLPITPEQIADHVIGAYEAGAAVAHIHVRDPKTGQPSSDLELFRKVATRVKSECSIILCFTTGGGAGMTPEERVSVVPMFKPELASMNAGSMNFGLFPLLDTIGEFKFPWEKIMLEMSEDHIFPNTFRSMRVFCETFYENGTKPELEVYDTAMINNIAFMIQRGILKKPVYIQFVMGILGGIQPDFQNLSFLYETAKRQIGDFQWSVCAAGRYQIPMCTIALAIGGNVRVGMEDNLWVGKGVQAKSSADQVEKIVRIAKELGIDPATPDEARQILGLKGIDEVNY